MANTILLKRSAVKGKIPTATELHYGELAVNYLDGTIYLKRSDNSVIKVAQYNHNHDERYIRSFSVVDGDGTAVNISQAKSIKFINGSNVNVNFTDTTPGSAADPYDLTISVPDGSTTVKGAVQLSTSTTSTSTALAATPSAVKAAMDKANAANTLAGTKQTATQVAALVKPAQDKANSAYNLAHGKWTAAAATDKVNGYVKLSDSTTDAVNGVAQHIAATPKAVKAAMDKANSAYSKAGTAATAAAAANTLAGTKQTATQVAAAVKPAQDKANSAYTLADKANKAAATKWTGTAATDKVNGYVKLSDSTASTSAATAHIAATPKAVKAAMDKANSAYSLAGTKQTAAQVAAAVKPAQDKANSAYSKADAANKLAATKITQSQSDATYKHGSHSLPSKTDLNTVVTPGFYNIAANSTAGTCKNLASNCAFSLHVYKDAGIHQVFTPYNSALVYRRAMYMDKWTAWYQDYSTAHKPTKADVGLSNVPNYAASTSTTSTSTSTLATSSTVKTAMDKANSAYSLAGTKQTSTQVAALVKPAQDKANSAYTLADKANKAAATKQTAAQVAALVKPAQDKANSAYSKADAAAKAAAAKWTGTAATATAYGYTKLSDSTTSTSAATAHIAATPKAVKTAMDKANSAYSKADAAAKAVASIARNAPEKSLTVGHRFRGRETDKDKIKLKFPVKHNGRNFIGFTAYTYIDDDTPVTGSQTVWYDFRLMAQNTKGTSLSLRPIYNLFRYSSKQTYSITEMRCSLYYALHAQCDGAYWTLTVSPDFLNGEMCGFYATPSYD